ncbi:MAG: serine hydrolase [Bacteroidia bacterium]|nr:serine hydrolase [Bacteroidia bacterium]
MSYKFSFICLKSSIVAVSLLLLQPLYAQYSWRELEDELKDKQKMLGTDAEVMIWKGDSLVYKRDMGDFDSKTVKPIASCSKWLTAALVMMFVDEGKISLDDPVVKYIPIFGNYFKSYITIRHCLSHMTGITDEVTGLKKLLQRRKIESLEEEMNDFAKREIRANAGQDFWYGNIGLNIAARVLEVVGRKRFDLLIKTKLFNPLGMRKTTFSTMDGSVVNPSGGAQSTADDYMKFLVMLLNKGKYNGKQILSEASVNQMMQVQNRPEQIKYAPKAGEGYNYALGSWAVEQKNGVATSLASPGLFGTWPMVDFCRGYAYIFFAKNLLVEERADTQRDIKTIIDKQIVSTCN